MQVARHQIIVVTQLVEHIMQACAIKDGGVGRLVRQSERVLCRTAAAAVYGA